MSAVIALSSLLVGLAITAAPGVNILGITKMIDNFAEKGKEGAEPILTRFKDKELLKKTLEEHGFSTEFMEDGSLLMVNESGKIRFFQEERKECFQAFPIELKDTTQFCEDLEQLHDEYMTNVQTHTYQHLKENLNGRTDLSLESEQVLEDDTIVLTLTVN